MSEKHEITNVLRALHTQGITKVEIEYSGGGDEGTFENSKFYNQDNKEISVDWNKTLDLSEDETFDIDDFEGLIYGDQGRLNQWYSFAGDYSVSMVQLLSILKQVIILIVLTIRFKNILTSLDLVMFIKIKIKVYTIYERKRKTRNAYG